MLFRLTRLSAHSGSLRDSTESCTYHYPLSDALVKLKVKDGLLESGQRPVRVHQPALHKHVTVAFKVITGRSRLQGANFLFEEFVQFVRACTSARVGLIYRRAHTDVKTHTGSKCVYSRFAHMAVWCAILNPQLLAILL